MDKQRMLIELEKVKALAGNTSVYGNHQDLSKLPENLADLHEKIDNLTNLIKLIGSAVLGVDKDG